MSWTQGDVVVLNPTLPLTLLMTLKKYPVQSSLSNWANNRGMKRLYEVINTVFGVPVL